MAELTSVSSRVTDKYCVHWGASLKLGGLLLGKETEQDLPLLAKVVFSLAPMALYQKGPLPSRAHPLCRYLMGTDCVVEFQG